MLKKIWQQHNLLILILFLAFGLRLPHLNDSLWLDEAAQALESARPWAEQLKISADFQPPLLHLVLFFTLKLSHAEWWMRTVAALIPGLVTIWATYELGRRLVNQKTGLLAALLLATSSFHIFYSQELRPYSLPTMLALCSYLPLLKALKAKKINTRAWLSYAVLSFLGLYSSYLYPFFLLAQFIWVIWMHQKKTKEILTIGFWLILGFLPWLPSFLRQLKEGQAVRKQLPGWEEVVSISQLKSIALVVGKFIYGVMNIEVNLFFITTFLVLSSTTLTLVYLNKAHFKQKKHAYNFKFLLSWLMVPLLFAWIISFIVPIVRPKRVLFLLPTAYILITYLGTIGRKKIAQRLGTLLPALFLAINIFSICQYHLNPLYQREDWRSLHHQIMKDYSPQETVLLFSYPHPFSPWRWYDQEQYPTLSTGELYIKNVTDLTLVIKKASEYKYIILFDYLRDLTDPDDQLRTELWALGFHEINTLDYPNIGFVRIYSRHKPTAQL